MAVATSWHIRGSYFESCKRVGDGPLSFDYTGTCGYATTFDYSG